MTLKYISEVNFTARNENDIKISDLEKNIVDKDLTLEELGKVVKSMPNGKTLGCDGLPIEFYKVFWNKIGDWVLDAFNYAFQQGNLHISARRGLRQGCPISPYLFLVTAEILAIYIRKNKKIKGIKIGDVEYKLLQYADDTNLFSQYDANSLNAVIESFKWMRGQAGLKANYEKTCIYRIGSLRTCISTGH